MRLSANQRHLLHAGTLLFLWGAAQPCFSQRHSTLCNHGSYSFRADSPTGVSVVLGPSHARSLATRTCAAELLSGKKKLTVADQVPQADLDLFAVDVGLASPVAAFQLQRSPDTCCFDYEIYSLRDPPHLLRALRGGFFNGADTTLDGRVEIWAEDGEAFDKLDDLPATAFDYLPTYVLRFENGRLLDATKDFTPQFDDMIVRLRSRLTPDQLGDFKHSDGQLTFAIAKVERLHNLRGTKIAVLEIVWNYLYSGREAEAWKSLREMWPDADFERMQREIKERHTRGLFSQIDGIAPRASRKKHRLVYEQAEVVPARAMNPSFPDIGVSLPEEVDFDLVIDSAGKVRDIKPQVSLDPRIVAQAQAWKFVPATKGGHSVASHLHLRVSSKR